MHIEIRESRNQDKADILKILNTIIQKGGTYVFDTNTPEQLLDEFWFKESHFVYVALLNEKVVGSFWLCKNQPDHGEHIANAAYIVSPHCEGEGIGKSMAHYSIDKAREMGFEAMQFNYVIAKNSRAVTLWKRHGFKIIGTIPEGYKGVNLDYSDVYIMYKKLN